MVLPSIKIPWPWKVAILLLLAVALFLGGRCSRTPETKTVEKVVVQYKDRVVTQTVQSEAKTQVRVVYRDRIVIRKPDGEIVTHNVVKTEQGQSDRVVNATTKTSTNVAATSQVGTSVPAAKTAVDRPRWHVNLLAGVEATALSKPQLLGPIALGAQVEYRLIGPLWIGAFGITSGSAGISLGVEF